MALGEKEKGRKADVADREDSAHREAQVLCDGDVARRGVTLERASDVVLEEAEGVVVSGGDLALCRSRWSERLIGSERRRTSIPW
jgi:hypothetical protein